jgi:DNA-directed RNA polymerase subunit RPC12/RpoP
MTAMPPSREEAADAAVTATQRVAERPHMFPCEGCGADLEFHIGVQGLQCPYCGFTKAIDFADDAQVGEQDFHAALARLAEQRSPGGGGLPDEREVRCLSCAAVVRFIGTLTSQTCAYCGSPLQLDKVHDAAERVPVDGVLAFAVQRAQAHTNLRTWVSSRWFAPNAFKKQGVDGKFNGVYTPFWTYDSLTFTRYVGQRGEHYWVTVGSGKNRRRVRRTRWYPASDKFQRFFDDVLVVAARGLPKKRLDALEPWPLARCVPFARPLLAGFLARTYDVELGEGFAEARGRIDEAIAAEVRQRIGGDEQRIHNIDTRYDALTYKHLLLPVWMLAYRFREKAYQVVVNAATGEVQGDRPYSWVKITLAVLAGLAVAGGIAYIASQS